MGYLNLVIISQLVLLFISICAEATEVDQPKQILRPGPMGGQPPIYGSPSTAEQEQYRGGLKKDWSLPGTAEPSNDQPVIRREPPAKK